jgi:hypothetical protein
VEYSYHLLFCSYNADLSVGGRRQTSELRIVEDILNVFAGVQKAQKLFKLLELIATN